MAYSHLFGGTDVRVYGYGPSFYGGGGSAPNYSIEVRGYNYERTRAIAEDLKRRLERFSRVRDVNTNSGGNYWMNDRAVEYVVELNRPRLAAHNLTAQEVVSQVGASVRGRSGQSNLRVGGEDLSFDVKFEGHRSMSVLELNELLLRNAAGTSNVRLGEVASVRQREVLSQIDRTDQQYQRFVRYEFRGPSKLGDRVRDAVIEATLLPEGYEIIGQQEWSWGEEDQAQIWKLLSVSLVLIFMVTAALFESIKLPFVVLLTVPMAVIGVFMIFFFADATFTREAYIGVIMMGGIVVNNAILLVDHINQKRRIHGMALKEAIVTGTLERVRPILMTSATTIFGLLPLVLFSETADANIWNALGFALIGGLIASTFFVLTVTPALYTISEARREKKRIAHAKAQLEAAPA
jgi:multidrug efflux pump subunit AcrB